LLRTGVLFVNAEPALWQDVASRLRPFIASRVSPTEIEDVLQDVFIRMQRGLPGLRDEERFTSWLFQIARNSVAEHQRSRARHPLPDVLKDDEPPAETSEDDRDASRSLSACVSLFVARLPSPYREAVTLVELEGLTAREAADMAGISVSGMKSRVQRGRAQLRQMFDECCEIALDARGKVTDYTPRVQPKPCCPKE
jgi:RNA polymerase sigma-70 factor (ECF subfamily)